MVGVKGKFGTLHQMSYRHWLTDTQKTLNRSKLWEIGNGVCIFTYTAYKKEDIKRVEESFHIAYFREKNPSINTSFFYSVLINPDIYLICLGGYLFRWSFLSSKLQCTGNRWWWWFIWLSSVIFYFIFFIYLPHTIKYIETRMLRTINPIKTIKFNKTYRLNFVVVEAFIVNKYIFIHCKFVCIWIIFAFTYKSNIQETRCSKNIH